MKTNLHKKLKKEIAQVRDEKAKVNIGKNGISPTIITEINNQFKHNVLLKIKFLKNFLTDDFESDINELCKKTKSQLVEKRGKTIIIYKSKN